MHPSAMVLLSFVAFTAASATLSPASANTVTNTNTAGLAQLAKLISLLSASSQSSPSSPSTTPNTLPSLTDLLGAGSAGSGTGTGGAPPGQGGLNSVLRNPLLFALMKGDISRQGLLLSSLTGNSFPGSPATRISLLREGPGEYFRYAGADVLMNVLSQASNRNSMILPFMMREMFPENYLFNNLLFNNQGMGGLGGLQAGSGTGGSGGMSNSLLPAFLMGDMV